MKLLVSILSLCCSLFGKPKVNFMTVCYQDGLFLLRISYATALGRIGWCVVEERKRVWLSKHKSWEQGTREDGLKTATEIVRRRSNTSNILEREIREVFDSLRNTMPLCALAERVRHFNSWFILNSANPLQSRENQGGVTAELWELYFGKGILE